MQMKSEMSNYSAETMPYTENRNTDRKKIINIMGIDSVDRGNTAEQ